MREERDHAHSLGYIVVRGSAQARRETRETVRCLRALRRQEEAGILGIAPRGAGR